MFHHAKQYGDGITMSVVVAELTRNILLAMVCVFVCSLFLISNVTATLIVCCSVSVTLLCVAGKTFDNNWTHLCAKKTRLGRVFISFAWTRSYLGSSFSNWVVNVVPRWENSFTLQGYLGRSYAIFFITCNRCNTVTGMAQCMYCILFNACIVWQ